MIYYSIHGTSIQFRRSARVENIIGNFNTEEFLTFLNSSNYKYIVQIDRLLYGRPLRIHKKQSDGYFSLSTLANSTIDRYLDWRKYQRILKK